MKNKMIIKAYAVEVQLFLVYLLMKMLEGKVIMRFIIE